MSIFRRWWPRSGAGRTLLAAGFIVLGSALPILWDLLYGEGLQALSSSPKSVCLMLLGLGLLQGWRRARRAIRDLLAVVLPGVAIVGTVVIGYGVKEARPGVIAFAAGAVAAFLAAFTLLMSDSAWEYIERPPEPWGADWGEPIEGDAAAALPADASMLPGERVQPELVVAAGVSQQARGMGVRQGRGSGEA